MISVDVQYACEGRGLPETAEIAAWVTAALAAETADAELTVRIVDEAEGAELNRRWRGKDGPTNVLSFPAEGLDEVAPALLGDIVVCAPVVEREAKQQGKEPAAHWAHMIVHGTLHLVGYIHDEAADAEVMESMESGVLAKLGYGNPY